MRALSASELLNVWERGKDKTSVNQALLLLAAACPETSVDQLAKLSLGQRDKRLLTLREWIFGSQLPCSTVCPGCRERLELVFNVADIRSTSKDEPAGEISANITDYELRFRLPCSHDIEAITDCKDASSAQKQLLDRCLLTIHHDGEKISTDKLPADVEAEIIDRMAKTDLQADVLLDLSCPSCEHKWRMVFDIVSFFWSEITAWAYRIMREVHALALAYGWSESDILSMSSWRRQFYLEMIG